MNITKTKKNCKRIRSTKEMEEQILIEAVAASLLADGCHSCSGRRPMLEEPYTGEIDGMEELLAHG